MKIAHLVIGGDVAGGQMVALALARGARRRGDEVMFVSPGKGAFTELVSAEGYRVLFADVSRTFRLGDLRRLAALLRRERVDVLHTHTALAANVLGRIAGRHAGVAVVSHIHIENHFRPQALARAVHRTLDNRTARLCARVVTVSDDTRASLVRQGYPERLVETVPNGIGLGGVADDLARRAAVREELGLAADAQVVVEVARLCDVKGQRELIGATALLAESHPALRLVLVGRDLEQGGAYEESLRRQATELEIDDRVVFAGYRGDAGAVMAAADVLALPSTIEGMPLVVLEAMARSRPIVATPVGGTPEVIVDGETGLLVPPGDPPALAAAVRRLLDDPAGAERIGRAGRARIEERFSEEAMVARILAIYDEVAHSR